MNMENNLNLLEIEEFNSDDHIEFSKRCAQISEDVKSEKLSILQLIEQLGPILVNPSHSKRALGLSILTEVLKNLPIELLNSEQLTVISAFFCDKLKDHHQVVVAAITGVLVIIKFKNISGGCITQLLTSIFHNVTCQQQQQEDRHTVYKIFECLLQRHTQELMSMGLDFVYGVISAIDGERDPKNLIFLFNWIRTFLIVISLGHLAEEMFEVLACYFPVDFKAPPHDPNAITREALAGALCPCLCAIPEFAEFCLPLALEKLDSSLKIAKTDSLQLLKEGCKNFDVSSYLQHSSEIWSAIQKEIINTSDQEIENECLQTLSAIINKLSEANEEAFKTILNDIFDTLKANLLPDSKLFRTSSIILIATAAACDKSSNFITKKVVPLLENTFMITNNPKQKAVLLKTIRLFVKNFIKFNNSNKIESDLSTLPVLCLKASMDTDNDLRATAFECLKEIADFIPGDMRISLLQHLHGLLIESQSETVRTALLHCLKKFAENYSEEVIDNVLHKTPISNAVQLNLYLEALCTLITIKTFTEIVVNILMTYAFDVNTAVVSIKNIRNVLETNQDDAVLDMFFQNDLIEKLVSFTISQKDTNVNNKPTLLDINSILQILIGSREIEVQKKIIDSQKNFIEASKTCYIVYVILLNGLYIRIKKNVPIDYNIVDDLTNIAINTKDNFVGDILLQLLANLINKISNEEILGQKLQIVKTNCLMALEIEPTNIILLVTWITKALVMRNHVQANAWTDWLLNLLGNHDDVAKGFRIIMNDSYEALNSISYSNKMLLYRQKFFIYTTNKISENYSVEKTSYLNAVGYLIENVPRQAIIMQFKKILKLVILCLQSCNEPEVLLVILNTLKDFISNKESVIEDNLEDFLLRILTLSSFEFSMNVRIAALKCLQQFTASFPIYKLLPLKQKVIQQLALCVDDKKRLVRKEAMDARTLWFLLDAPV